MTPLHCPGIASCAREFVHKGLRISGCAHTVGSSLNYFPVKIKIQLHFKEQTKNMLFWEEERSQAGNEAQCYLLPLVTCRKGSSSVFTLVFLTIVSNG